MIILAKDIQTGDVHIGDHLTVLAAYASEFQLTTGEAYKDLLCSTEKHPVLMEDGLLKVWLAIPAEPELTIDSLAAEYSCACDGCRKSWC